MAEQEKFEVKVLDISDLDKLMASSPEVTLDLEQDAWEYGAPPPKGAYRVKWVLDKEGLKQYQHSKDPRDVSYSIAMVGSIKSEDPDFDKVPVFCNLNTRVFRGKKINTMAGFYVKLATWYTKGVPPLPNPISDAKLAHMVVKILKAEPIVLAELDWKGSYKYQDKKGEDQWKNVCNKMEDFPVDKDGARIHIMTVAADGGGTAEVRAMLKVSRFFGKADIVPNYAAAQAGLVSGPRTVQPIKVEEPTLVMEEAPKIVKPNGPLPSNMVQASLVEASSDDSDLTLLEG